MSQSIDERILSMQFDNKQFEKGIAQTSESLEEFEDQLQFKHAEKGFDRLSAAASRFNVDGVLDQLDSIGKKFSVLETVVATFVTRTASDMYNWGKRMAKSLSIDQVTAGYSKYEAQTKSVYTISTATGKTVEETNKALDQLMWFTDETSYSFSDMVDNIGKFTSQGIALEDSIQAMEGIALAAAKAGQGTGEASRAMYNFSQALGQGSVKLMDWKSIENANMATEEFKNTIIEAAIAEGALINGGKTKKGTKVTAANFSSTLSEGWFNSKVLMRALKKYGSYADTLYEYIQTNDVDTASQAIKELGDAGDEFGRKAFEAGQQARTFTDAIEATKDAVSSQWQTTFRYIIGDTNEATELFTDLANGLWDVFAAGGEARNELLKLWNENEGRERLLNGIYDALEGIAGICDAVSSGLTSAFPEVTLDTLDLWTEKVETFGKKLKDTFGIIEKEDTSEKLVYDFAVNSKFTFEDPLKSGSKGDEVKELQKKLNEAGADLVVDGIFGPKTEEALKNWQKKNKIDETGIFDKDLAEMLFGKKKIGEHWEDQTFAWTEYTGAAGTLNQVFSNLSNVLELVRQGFDALGSVVGQAWGALAPIRGVIGDIFVRITDFIGQWAQGKIESGAIGEWLGSASEQLASFSEKVSAFAEKLRGFFGLDQEFGSFGEWVEHIKESFKALFGGDKSGDVDDAASTAEDIGNKVGFIGKIVETIKQWFKPIVDFFTKKDVGEAANAAKKNEGELSFIGKIFAKIKEFLGGIFSDAGEEASDSFVGKAIAKIKSIFGLIGDFFKNIFSGGDGAKTAESAGFFGSLIEKIKAAFENTDIGGIAFSIAKFVIGFKTFLNLYQMSSSILKAIKSFGSIGTALATTIRSFGKVVKDFGEIGQAVQDRIRGVKPESTATKILKIAVAIGIIALAVKLVASIDTKDALTAAGILLGMMAVIVIMALVIDKLQKNTGKAKVSNTMIEAALALVMLAVAMRVIGDLSPEKAIQGVLAIGALLTLLALFMLVTDKSKAGSKGLLGLSVAVFILAKVVKALGEMDPLTAVQGVLLLGVILTELMLFILLTKKSKAGVKGLLSLSIAVFILARVVKQLGEMDPARALQGVAALGLILAELALFVVITSKSKAGTTLGTMLALALFVAVAARVVMALGSMDAGKALQGVAVLGIIMAELAVFIYATQKMKSGVKVGNLLALALFITVAAVVVRLLGSMDPLKALQGVAALGVIMAELALFIYATKNMKAGTTLGTMLALSIFIAVASSVVHSLGSMDPMKALQGVAALGFIMAELALFMTSLKGAKVGSSLLAVIGLVLFVSTATRIVVELGSMDPWKALQGIAALGLILAELTAVVFVLGKSKNDLNDIGIVTTLADAVKTIAEALVAIGVLSPTQMLAGVAAIGIIFGGFILAMQSMRDAKSPKISTIISLFAIVIAVRLLIGGLVKIAKLGFSRAAAGAVGLVGVVTALVGVALALKLMSNVGKISTQTIVTFSLILGIVMLAMAGFTFLVSRVSNVDPSVILAFSAAFVGVMLAMIGVAVACALLDKIGISSNAVKGAASIAAVFAIIVGIGVAIMAGLGQLNSEGILAEKIRSGGDTLKALVESLNIFDDSFTSAAALGGMFVLSEVVGATGQGGNMIKGALAIEAVFGIVVGLSTAIMAGIGKINEKGILEDDVESGGDVLRELVDALNVFEDPYLSAAALGGMFVLSEIAGLTAGTLVTGAAAISIAFGLVVGLGTAIIAGLGKINEEGILVADIQSGGEVLSALADALNVFDDPFKSAAALGGLFLLSEVGGLTAGVVVPGAAAITIAFGIVAGLSSAILAGIGKINEVTDGDLVQSINEGGEVLASVGGALGKFGGAFKQAFSASDDNIEAAQNVSTLQELAKSELTTEDLDPALDVMDSVASFMNKIGGYENLERGQTPGFVSSLFGGEQTAFQTVLSGIVDMANTFIKEGAILLTLKFDTIDYKTPLTKLTESMDVVAKFMNQIGGYKNLDREQGVFARLFGQETAFATVLHGIDDMAVYFSEGTEGDGLAHFNASKIKAIDDETKAKFQAIIDLMDIVAQYMSKVGGYKNLEKQHGELSGLFQDKTAFETVLSGFRSTANLFTDKTFTIPDISDDMRDDFENIIDLMDEVASFMDDLSKYTIEKEPSWFSSIFGGEDTAFNTVLKGCGDAVDQFKAIQPKLDEFSVDADFQNKFQIIIDVMNSVAGLMNTVSGITWTDTSLSYHDLINFITTLSEKIFTFNAIDESDNTTAYINRIQLITQTYSDLATALQKITEYVDQDTTLQNITDYGNKMVKALTESGTDPENVSSALTETFGEAIAEGLVSQSTLDTSVTLMLNGVITTVRGFYNSMYQAGGFLVSGLINGINNKKQSAISAGTLLANDVTEAMKKVFDQHSPSKVTYQMGVYLDEGLALGMEGGEKDLIKSTLRTTGGMLAALSTTLSEGIDTTPTIRPVLDLSDVNSNIGLLDGYLSDRSLNVRTSSQLASSVRSGGSVITSSSGSGPSAAAAIADLKAEVVALRAELGKMQVVMDGRALVGQIGPKMDGYLGHRAAQERRRGG